MGGWLTGGGCLVLGCCHAGYGKRKGTTNARLPFKVSNSSRHYHCRGCLPESCLLLTD